MCVFAKEGKILTHTHMNTKACLYKYSLTSFFKKNKHRRNSIGKMHLNLQHTYVPPPINRTYIDPIQSKMVI